MIHLKQSHLHLVVLDYSLKMDYLICFTLDGAQNKLIPIVGIYSSLYLLSITDYLPCKESQWFSAKSKDRQRELLLHEFFNCHNTLKFCSPTHTHSKIYLLKACLFSNFIRLLVWFSFYL